MDTNDSGLTVHRDLEPKFRRGCNILWDHEKTIIPDQVYKIKSQDRFSASAAHLVECATYMIDCSYRILAFSHNKQVYITD